jgi:DNA-damage-inducible protein J
MVYMVVICFCIAFFNTLCYAVVYKDDGGMIMSAKSANIIARVEPEIKEQAESIMEQLGLSASGVINMLYRQIILRRGLPFAVIIPPAPPTMDAMTHEEFDSMLAEGLKQAESGEGVELHEAFRSLRSELRT